MECEPLGLLEQREARELDHKILAALPGQEVQVGQRLLQETERLIRQAGGSRIYVDTSQRLQYASTRAFYENAGYRLDAVLKEFYAPGDNKVIYCKSV